MDSNLAARLASHRTVGSAPAEELAWLVSHGTLRQLEAGQVLTPKGTRPQGLFIVLSGSFSMSVDRGAGPHKIMEWREGDVMGMLPYSRVSGPPGDSVAQEDSEILEIPAALIRPLAETCHGVTGILVHAMVDRARAFTASDLHDEKMISLGRLSAGLAHELNNPASAIQRSAALLESRIDEQERTARALGSLTLPPAQRDAASKFRAACEGPAPSSVRSALEQARHEDAIADWLDDRGLDSATAASLADSPVTLADLDALAGTIQGPALDAVLRWGASVYAVSGLAREIQEAATRISGLVQAIKGFTHMDQAPVSAPVDLALGLSSTVAVLRGKARAKSAAVKIEIEPGLPLALGFGGELNQVWANLIDNALDAIPEGGRVDVRASHQDRKVIVTVTDDGPGIPANLRDRIFDPFFTTKPMGQGTGLGLDIVRRLIRHNNGEISFDSRPGHTQFRVVVPAAGPASAGE